ncbi:hypothetical protein J5Y03_17540 [Bacillus sp. RG28]|uniref:Uncharacterized protein n=1 Tax=Gottfriedia endophytica TaxID=2820819 RepID=A0A940SLC0_9BACI|nr:hypothetical protein [Gottfriedia endophytica]MBP0726964.1 hypothetical protein [Gottfriedia endophytica]
MRNFFNLTNIMYSIVITVALNILLLGFMYISGLYFQIYFSFSLYFYSLIYLPFSLIVFIVMLVVVGLSSLNNKKGSQLNQMENKNFDSRYERFHQKK